MQFRWDPAQAKRNALKHGLEFETATFAFCDPLLVIYRDRFVEGEQRWHAVGMVEGVILLVVHVYIEEGGYGEEIIRIVSARRASKKERQIYLEQASL